MNEPSYPAPRAATPPPTTARGPAFYNVSEAAAIMRIDESTLYRHLRNGRFPGVKIGGRYVVPHVALERLIERVLADGRCLDIAEWTGEWQRALEQSRPIGAAVGGGA